MPWRSTKPLPPPVPTHVGPDHYQCQRRGELATASSIATPMTAPPPVAAAESHRLRDRVGQRPGDRHRHGVRHRGQHGSRGEVALSSTSLHEGDSLSLSGSFTDVGLRDSHTVSVLWSDPVPDSIFSLGATSGLWVGNTFASTNRADWHDPYRRLHRRRYRQGWIHRDPSIPRQHDLRGSSDRGG